MPNLPQLSDLIKNNCKDLTSCFQTIYNFLFAIFIALCFFYFLLGAFEYMLSGAGIYKKESGKSKMKNSIIALIIVLVIPIILNMINPGIFNVKLKVPKLTVKMPQLYEGEDMYAPSPTEVKPGFKRIKDLNLNNIEGNNVQVNERIVNKLKNLDKILGAQQMKIRITSGYSPQHIHPCHTQFGTCVDIQPITGNNCKDWKKLGDALQSAGAKIIFEDKIKDVSVLKSSGKGCIEVGKDECGIVWKQCAKTTGRHIHAEF